MSVCSSIFFLNKVTMVGAFLENKTIDLVDFWLFFETISVFLENKTIVNWFLAIF